MQAGAGRADGLEHRFNVNYAGKARDGHGRPPHRRHADATADVAAHPGLRHDADVQPGLAPRGIIMPAVLVIIFLILTPVFFVWLRRRELAPPSPDSAA